MIGIVLLGTDENNIMYAYTCDLIAVGENRRMCDFVRDNPSGLMKMKKKM